MERRKSHQPATGTPLSDRTLRIVLAANEAAGLRAYQHLAQSSHELAGVLAPSSSDARRGAAVADVARDRGHEVWPADRVKDPAFAETLRALEVDLLINVHSLFLIHADVIAAPTIGSFNLHPGPLPEYAGLNAPSWAVFNGEQSHAVTLHRMNPGVDTGDIAYESRFSLNEHDTGLTVSTRCVREGIGLVARLLDDASYTPHRIPARPQNLALRRVFKRREVPFDGRIEWSRSAKELDALVRAADFYPMPSPWGHPRATLDGREVEIVRVERTGRQVDETPGTTERASGTLEVATGDEWLRIKRLKVGDEYVDQWPVLH